MEGKIVENDILEICKVTLNVYGLLETLCKSLDRLILAEAKGSIFDFCEAEKSGEKILRLSEKKIGIINLKILIEKSLGGLKDKEIELLVARYVDGMKKDACLKIFGMCERSFYRKLNRALKLYKCNLVKNINKNPNATREIFGEDFFEFLFEPIDNFRKNGGDISKNRDLICNFMLKKLIKVN